MRPGAAPPHSTSLESSLRVLVVDDCRENRILVSAVLGQWGITPAIACNGAQAVQILGRQDFDIVFMDLFMPVMDGMAATAKIRQAEREEPGRAQVPIVAYTSLDLNADPIHLSRVGLTAVLAKPCSPTTMQSCLALHCPDKFMARI
jgi:CheY-like chemotaxis protein